MLCCSECGDRFEPLGDWQKMCPKCYYALNPDKDKVKQTRDRQLSMILKDRHHI